MVIVAFDVAGKHLSIMSLQLLSLPDMQGCCIFKLNLFGGCLGISYRTKDRKAGLWVMKEYNRESSWTKLNVVLPCDDGMFFLLCFTNGGELVGMQCNRANTKLIKFSDKVEWADSQTITCDRTDKMMVTWRNGTSENGSMWEFHSVGNAFENGASFIVAKGACVPKPNYSEEQYFKVFDAKSVRFLTKSSGVR
ncbi:hypothetical protein PIB30_049519 [Stylosanthes scabra]|uniref:F-box associated domain-containing protein n=1 Tax=Stylosanthes scabra TaxID=79078 RepID=A0ABU6VHG9_9FABA|nr:hypothetical protein [Stylosanthes scabra]